MQMWYHSKVLILQESCHEKGEVNTRGPLTTILRAVRAVEGTSHQLGHSAALRWEMSFQTSVGWNMLKCLYHPLVCEWGYHIQSLTCMQLCLIDWLIYICQSFRPAWATWDSHPFASSASSSGHSGKTELIPSCQLPDSFQPGIQWFNNPMYIPI